METQASYRHSEQSALRNPPFAHEVTSTKSQCLFENQEDPRETEGYARSFPLSYGQQNNIVPSADIRNPTGNQRRSVKLVHCIFMNVYHIRN